jgi:hypothetical protein
VKTVGWSLGIVILLAVTCLVATDQRARAAEQKQRAIARAVYLALKEPGSLVLVSSGGMAQKSWSMSTLGSAEPSAVAIAGGEFEVPESGVIEKVLSEPGIRVIWATRAMGGAKSNDGMTIYYEVQ